MEGNDRQGANAMALYAQSRNLLRLWTEPRLWARTGWFGATVWRTTLLSRTAVGNGKRVYVSDGR